MDRQQIMVKAIATYGETLQKTVAMEECSELIKEISKDIRGSSTKTQITSEMADVSIMLKELQIIYNISDRELEQEIDYKLVRLNNKLNHEIGIKE